ncbi:uncharacterized protein LOC123683151 [Harmonia axyridis]|uniref:uncharacterized protein LOC123683151 n=1 Tax=Harmonia axyridis TaxID=115357 RepID=UPI001E27760A|nr:uncharacterized protein LOC123683151 [Harmonia axyridis]
MYLKLLDLIITAGWCFSLNKAAVITVDTPLGLYGGCYLTSRLGKTIYTFRGIRYAEPPINELRFKPPVPVKPHNGIYDATKDGPVCPQPTKFKISEDCLLLNVYTTCINITRKKPVIVYLHAGGFYSGSSRSDSQGPQYLLDQDIVLVTINYRLATLGFLSLGLQEAPGNNGFKDQVVALKWIQSNIYAFGGDPDLVTLAGCSAGAASVSLHMVSPMSEGLFHRAIISSGSFLSNWLIPKDQYGLAQKQASIFGCIRYETTKHLMDCLNNATSQQYADSVMKFREFHNDPVIIWGPVLEDDFGQERFLIEHPIKSAWYGNFTKIPIMAGITTKEFGYEAVDILLNPDLLKKLNNEWEKYAPIVFMYEQNSIKSKKISEGLKHAYFGYEPIDSNTTLYLQQLYADGITGFGVNRAVELFSTKNDNPVYYYNFAYPGRYSHYRCPCSNNTIHFGAVHQDDLIYLFQNADTFPKFTEKDPETKMVDRWTSVWADFAKTGEPLPKEPERFDRITWEPYKPNKERYLEAGQKFEIKDGLNKPWYQVWKNLFPLVDYFDLKKREQCSIISNSKHSRMISRSFPVFIFLALTTTCQQCSNPIVDAPKGKYEGSRLTSRLGKTICAFRGIKYAQAPINELRFKPPVPTTQHDGIYDAKNDGPVCPQITNDPISEDCLLLNIYTTKLPTENSNPRRPVIIYLHPGGFYEGSGRSNWFGPHYFMDQDIVLVTINYRLGALGFLSTGEREAVGNNGLKDQVVAMKWVKENIEAFGGDPNSIALFGYSAGSVSVMLHLMSPMSEGLFHKAIMGSASELSNYPIGNSQIDLARRQAKILGCPYDTSSNIVECLKGKSANELGGCLRELKEFGVEPVLVWKPVIEPDFGQERFLTDHPIKLALQGKFRKMPMLAGITNQEFGHRAELLIENKTLFDEINKNWEKLAPIVFLYERETENSKQISKALRFFYFPDGIMDNSSVDSLSKLYADAQTGWGMNRAVKLLSEDNKESVYYYKFSYQGRYSHYNHTENNQTVPYGVGHHDDLIYLFTMPERFPSFQNTDPEYKMVDKMTKLYANFVKTGKPISEICEELDSTEWTPFDSQTGSYMDIGENLNMSTKLFEKRYSEWEKLFPLSSYENPTLVTY